MASAWVCCGCFGHVLMSGADTALGLMSSADLRDSARTLVGLTSSAHLLLYSLGHGRCCFFM